MPSPEEAQPAIKRQEANKSTTSASDAVKNYQYFIKRRDEALTNEDSSSAKRNEQTAFIAANGGNLPTKQMQSVDKYDTNTQDLSVGYVTTELGNIAARFRSTSFDELDVINGTDVFVDKPGMKLSLRSNNTGADRNDQLLFQGISRGRVGLPEWKFGYDSEGNETSQELTGGYRSGPDGRVYARDLTLESNKAGEAYAILNSVNTHKGLTINSTAGVELDLRDAGKTTERRKIKMRPASTITLGENTEGCDIEIRPDTYGRDQNNPLGVPAVIRVPVSFCEKACVGYTITRIYQTEHFLSLKGKDKSSWNGISFADDSMNVRIEVYAPDGKTLGVIPMVKKGIPETDDLELIRTKMSAIKAVYEAGGTSLLKPAPMQAPASTGVPNLLSSEIAK